MPFTLPTTDDFKTRFDRDFPYAVPEGQPTKGDDTQLSKVRDTDITRAILGANININQGLFPDQSTFNEVFLQLAAHTLCRNLLASTQGLSGQFTWLTAMKSAGGVESKYEIPDRIKNSPFLSSLSLTRYGAAYLEYIMPYLVGNAQLAATTGGEPAFFCTT